MTDEMRQLEVKKMRQLEVVEGLGRALLDLCCEGIYLQDDMAGKITLVDGETGEQIGQVAYSNIDEFTITDDYFRDALKSFRERMNGYPE